VTDKQSGLYAGTLGFVPVDTSRDRAEREQDNGTADDRLRAVERELQRLGMVGATWQRLAKLLNLHHGQVSSALTVLHRQGRIAMTSAKQNRCHYYIHADYIPMYDPSEVYLRPSKTLATRKAEAGEALADAVVAYCDQLRDSLLIDHEMLYKALAEYRKVK
jgi:hypothetical protein